MKNFARIPLTYCLLGYILLSLVASFAITSTAINYILFVIIVVIWMFFALVGIKKKVRLVWFDCIPAIFLLVWLYGLVLGFLLGNHTIFVISNFAGMSLYIIYFFMLFSNITSNQLIKIVLIAAVVNALYSYGQTAWLVLIEDRPYLTMLRTYYSPGLSVLGPCISMSLVMLIFYKRQTLTLKLKHSLGALFFLLPYGVLSFSKGYFASLVILLLLILVVIAVTAAQRLTIKTAGFVYALFCFVVVIAVVQTFGQELFFLYSAAEASNSVRVEQAPMLIQEINVIGNGLGAVLESGYFRNENQPYGFELSYLAILHKFGLMGALLWIAYASCILVPLQNIHLNRTCLLSWLALGGMLYLVPSYGNPLLFHPAIVVLHCVILHWIRSSIVNTRERRYVQR